jgi:hypothetical protein
MKEKQTTKPQTKAPTVEREGVRLLAIELGASAAARKLGLSPNTVRSWAKRYNWNLPARAGRPAIVPATDLQRPGDILLEELKENEEATRTSMSIAARRAAEATAVRSERFPVCAQDAQELQQLAGAMARIFGWASGSQPSVNYYGDVNTVVVCDEARRRELIEQRQRLLEQEATLASSREVEAAAPAALPEKQPPAVQPEPISRHMESIGKAETWGVGQGSDQENHAGSFGPYPEEYEVW